MPQIGSFNTQPPEGGWQIAGKGKVSMEVSTHSRLKAAGTDRPPLPHLITVSTHSRLKAAGMGTVGVFRYQHSVSTHSRLKAAGASFVSDISVLSCFNTQPPEGGWNPAIKSQSRVSSFNTQPPEGGWRTGRKAS